MKILQTNHAIGAPFILNLITKKPNKGKNSETNIKLPRKWSLKLPIADCKKYANEDSTAKELPKAYNPRINDPFSLILVLLVQRNNSSSENLNIKKAIEIIVIVHILNVNK